MSLLIVSETDAFDYRNKDLYQKVLCSNLRLVNVGLLMLCNIKEEISKSQNLTFRSSLISTQKELQYQ